ncbi:hypothetical protein [Streptomyces sp. SM12]|uniref:hypothetical protein n=1 Tax=Streptomyces sp. SM12 TaxID=1071602 RepID=UPI000CD56DCA|nr:hypothetical protein [Streptomyces sp. SM12]
MAMEAVDGGALVGRWVLVGAVEEEVPVEIADTPDDLARDEGPAAVVAGVRLPLTEVVRRWLAGELPGERPEPVAVGGLTLVVTTELAFHETGSAPVPWFTDEGVLEPAALSFGGRVELTAAGAFLLLSRPVPWARGHVEGRLVPERLDDGDTVITDRLAPSEGGLERTVSVVTDGVVLTRVRYSYAPAAG